MLLQGALREHSVRERQAPESGAHPRLDVLRSVGIQQGGPRLLEVRAGRADVGDHHCAAVAP